MGGFSNQLVFAAKAIISSWKELGGPAVAPRELGTRLVKLGTAQDKMVIRIVLMRRDG
jgi:hypothetical protein